MINKKMQSYCVYCRKSYVLAYSIMLFFLSFIFYLNTDDGELLLKSTVLLESSPFNVEQALISVAKNGNFLVGDPNLGKVSVFNSEGNFIKSFGRPGRGPGEFDYLIHLIQLNSGDYLISDLSGKIERFDASGKHLQSYPIPILGRTSKLTEIDSNTILIAGLNSRDENFTLLHLMDLRSGEIINSFFEAPFQMSDYGGLLHSMSEFSNALFDGTLIYAFLSFSDVMYIFDKEGEFIEMKKLTGFNQFLPLRPSESSLNNDQLIQKMMSHSIISNLYWKDSSTIILEHVKAVDIQLQPFRHSVEYGMAVLNTEGEFIYENNSMFRIYGYDKEGMYLYSGHESIPELGEPIIEISTIVVE